MHIALVGPDLEENLSIRYLAGALRAEGHTPTIVPFDRAEDLERVRSAIRNASVDLVALSMCYQIRAPEFLKLARDLKVDDPGRPVVAGGHYASCMARDLLERHPALEVVVIHEGERTLVELASLPQMTPRTGRRVPSWPSARWMVRCWRTASGAPAYQTGRATAVMPSPPATASPGSTWSGRWGIPSCGLRSCPRER